MQTTTYIVKSGDSLSLISKNFFGDFRMADAIAQINNIENKNVIQPGQKLLIPVEEAEVIESNVGDSSSGKGKKIVIGLLLFGAALFVGRELLKRHKKKKLDSVFNGHFRRMHPKKKRKSLK